METSELCMFVLRRCWCQTVLDSVYKINWDHNEDMWKDKGWGRGEWETIYFCSWKPLCISIAPFLPVFQGTAQALVMAHARFGRRVRQFLSPFRGWVSGIWITHREKASPFWSRVVAACAGDGEFGLRLWDNHCRDMNRILTVVLPSRKKHEHKNMTTFINFRFELIFIPAGKASNSVRIGISSVKSCLSWSHQAHCCWQLKPDYFPKVDINDKNKRSHPSNFSSKFGMFEKTLWEER